VYFQDVFLIAANNMGDTVHDVVADLATNVITCPKLNGLKMGVHEALCCDFLCVGVVTFLIGQPPSHPPGFALIVCRSALYWWVGAWYIIAWSMFFCGCCSGQLARKRLVRFPWVRVSAHIDCSRLCNRPFYCDRARNMTKM
jgi:hypothetical protein